MTSLSPQTFDKVFLVQTLSVQHRVRSKSHTTNLPSIDSCLFFLVKLLDMKLEKNEEHRSIGKNKSRPCSNNEVEVSAIVGLHWY